MGILLAGAPARPLPIRSSTLQLTPAILMADAAERSQPPCATTSCLRRAYAYY